MRSSKPASQDTGLLVAILPVTITIVMGVIPSLPINLTGWQVLAPNLALAAVFYWAVYRPDLFPLFLAFVIGLIQDVLTGTFLGVQAILVTMSYLAILTQRRVFYQRHFIMSWWGYAVILAVVTASIWIVQTGLGGNKALVLETVLHWLLSVLFFPAVYGVCYTIQRTLLSS